MKIKNESVFTFNTKPNIRLVPNKISWTKANLKNKLKALIWPFFRSYQKKQAFKSLRKKINKSDLAQSTSLMRPGKLD